MRIVSLPGLWPRRTASAATSWVALGCRDAGGAAQFTYTRCEGLGDAARVTACGQGGLAQLAAWSAGGVFRNARVVLMLDAELRQLMVLDRPTVPDDEVADALRWPAAASLEKAAEELLYDAAPLPPLTDAGKPQMLLAATDRGRLAGLQATVERAGVRLDAIDVVDMGQRNAVLLDTATAATAAHVTLGASGGELLVGLVAGGELCVARNLPLPAGFDRARQDEALVERLVLHVQRAVDLFERQITRFAVAGAVIFREDFAKSTIEALRQVLPGQAREIGFADLAGAAAPPPDGDATATRLAALALLRCRQPQPSGA
jgi:hypothetical protein